MYSLKDLYSHGRRISELAMRESVDPGERVGEGITIDGCAGKETQLQNISKFLCHQFIALLSRN